MKALGKTSAAPGIEMLDWPDPDCGPNDVVVRVRRASICGTDLHIRAWDEWARKTIPVPMPIGHEFFGVIEALGREVRGLRVGERVSGEGHVTCGHCRNCRAGRRHLCRNTQGLGVNRPGAFAELVALPAVNVFPVPDAVPDEIACLLDPLGNAVHTALAFDLVGEDVLITGAGPIGCMAAAVCRHVGARNVVVTDVNHYRLELALKLGATRAVNMGGRASSSDSRTDVPSPLHAPAASGRAAAQPPVAGEENRAAPSATSSTQGIDPSTSSNPLDSVMQELGMVEGFDVGLEMSGHSAALRDLLDKMNHGGKVALLGIPSGEIAVDWSRIIFKGLELKGIYGREMFETWYKMSAMLQSGLDVSPIVTHRFAAADYLRAFDVAASGRSGKVLLDWNA